MVSLLPTKSSMASSIRYMRGSRVIVFRPHAKRKIPTFHSLPRVDYKSSQLFSALLISLDLWSDDGEILWGGKIPLGGTRFVRKRTFAQ